MGGTTAAEVAQHYSKPALIRGEKPKKEPLESMKSYLQYHILYIHVVYTYVYIHISVYDIYMYIDTYTSIHIYIIWYQYLNIFSSFDVLLPCKTHRLLPCLASKRENALARPQCPNRPPVACTTFCYQSCDNTGGLALNSTRIFLMKLFQHPKIPTNPLGESFKHMETPPPRPMSLKRSIG